MKGILLVNTGSPKTKAKKDVKKFIGAMLSDPQVMTVPALVRNILAKGIIAPLRASSSAAHYSLIWADEQTESPLLANTCKLAHKIAKLTNLPVEVAMRYGSPTIEEAFNQLLKKCPSLSEITVLPLFPQYAQSSYQTVADAIQQKYSQGNYPFNIHVLQPYYNHPSYIHALAESIKPHIEDGYDRLIFSFHSLPHNHVAAGKEKGNNFDYTHHIQETIKLITDELRLDPAKNLLTYSSAMGKKWLSPDINQVLKKLPAEGLKRVITIMPGFPADNLETLYDIDLIARETFMKNGGQKFTFVPCLNDNDLWAEAITQMIQ